MILKKFFKSDFFLFKSDFFYLKNKDKYVGLLNLKNFLFKSDFLYLN